MTNDDFYKLGVRLAIEASFSKTSDFGQSPYSFTDKQMLLPAPNSTGGGGGRGDVDAWAPASGVKLERPAYGNTFTPTPNGGVLNSAQDMLQGQLRDAFVQMAIDNSDSFLDSLMRRR